MQSPEALFGKPQKSALGKRFRFEYDIIKKTSTDWASGNLKVAPAP